MLPSPVVVIDGFWKRRDIPASTSGVRNDGWDQDIAAVFVGEAAGVDSGLAFPEIVFRQRIATQQRIGIVGLGCTELADPLIEIDVAWKVHAGLDVGRTGITGHGGGQERLALWSRGGLLTAE